MSTPATADAECPDLALVFAIDASGSVNDAEFAMQRQGYAAALRSPGVRAALSAAGIIDLGAVIFSDSEVGVHVIPMMRITDSARVEDMADRLAQAVRPVPGNTGIGVGVMAAIELLDEGCARRRIINLSGDGPESMAPRTRTSISTALAREMAAERGITINALAIEVDVPDLADWYGERLITGPDAFVMSVQDYRDFAAALERKIIRETGTMMLAEAGATP